MTSRRIETYFRFCPNCGIENPRPGVVPFRCGDCGYAHFFGPVAAVGALVVNDAGQMLVVRRARNPGIGKWGLPGGFVDQDETMEQALRREAYEETRLKICESEFLVSFPNAYDYRGIVMPVIDLFFVCRAELPIKIELADGELDHFQWVDPGDVDLDNMAFPSNRLAIERLRDRQPG